MSTTKKITRSTETTITHEFDRAAVLTVLKALKFDNIPEGADVEVFVPIPGGGDWSSTDLEIDKSSPLTIRIKYHTVEATEE